MDKELAIRYFKSLKGKKKPINRVEFTTSINVLNIESYNGFEEEEVGALVDALVNIKGLAAGRFKDILRCIVPRQTVSSDSSLKVIQWLFTYFNGCPGVSKIHIISILAWLVGLIEFGLTDAQSVHAFYQHFLLLIGLSDKVIVKYACKLLYLITKPSDVSRFRVKVILQTEDKIGKQEGLSCLLGLLKSYKPECVPEKVPAVSKEFAFRGVRTRSDVFLLAQERLQTENIADYGKRKINWNIDHGRSRTRVKTQLGAIPPVDYIDYESALTRKHTLHKVTEFDALTALGAQINLNFPCNSMSLLQNEAGIHALAFADEAVQSQFCYNLYYTLYTTFIEQESHNSDEEKGNLLKQIFKLEEYMQQGIPVVSRFLAKYMHVWDGDDFRDAIWNLFQWTTFCSYTELYHMMLVHVRRFFVCGNVKAKSLILNTLTKLVQNFVAVQVFKQENSSIRFFSGIEEARDVETLELIISYTSNLCELGVSIAEGNYLVLNEALNFFETLTFLEERHGLPIWTMMPPAVVYHGLITRSVVMLSRVCGLILKYEKVYPRLRSMNLRRKFTEHINQQRLYLADFISCLLKGECLQNEESYIFNNAWDKHATELPHSINMGDALLLQNHFVMLPYTAMMAGDSHGLLSPPYDQEDMKILAHSYGLDHLFALMGLNHDILLE